MKAWWENKAWPWLKKNWQWVLLPVGVLLLIGRAFSGRKTTVIGSELTGAAEAEREANEEAAEAVQEAKEERTEAVLEAQKARDEEIKVLTDEQKSRAKELASDPSALNDYLKNVGKNVRG